ncbi:outer membrane homotrimeric porin [Desulfothermus naphthae]
MKKLFLALLAGVFVLSYALSASATELKTYGYFRAYVSHVTNYNFDDDTDENEFTAAQRLRPYFDFIANENLKATLALEYDTTWGKKSRNALGDAGGAAGMDTTTNTELKRAMLTFKWPNTNILFKIGAQGMSLPGTFGGELNREGGVSPVFNGDITGAIVSAQINDMFGITFGWARPWVNEDDNALIGSESDENIDAFFLTVPVRIEGTQVTPYFLYATIGDRAYPAEGQVFLHSGGLQAYYNTGTLKEDDSDLWYAGMYYEISMFEPIVVKGNIIYGKLDSDIEYRNGARNEDEIGEREGWYVDLAIDYKMDFMTPSLYGYYMSGDDDDPWDGSECIPILASDGWGTPGGFAIGDTTFFDFNDNNYGLVQESPTGLWLIGFALKDISLIENLKSTFAIEYGKGTVDSDLIKKYGSDYVAQIDGNYVLTDEDSFIQVMLTNKYKIYENLAAVLELGYASLDMDDDTWENRKGKDYLDDDAYLVTFGFTYDF